MARCFVRCTLMVLFLYGAILTDGAQGVNSLPTSSPSPETESTTETVPTNQKPVCQDQVDVSMTKVQQETGDPIYCFNTTEPPCSDTEDTLNYTAVTASFSDILSLQDNCLMLLKTDLSQTRICITVFATEIQSETPQSDKFTLCVTFNEAPTFGTDASPKIINVKLLEGTQSIQIPVNTQPDSISLFEIAEVDPNSRSGDFAVSDNTQSVITYTKPRVIDIVNTSVVDLTVNVTDDGNPPLMSQSSFPIILVNDDVTCTSLPTLINVDTDNPADPITVIDCQSSAGNQLTYAVNFVSDGSSLEMSIDSSGAVTVGTSSQVADFDVTVDAQSIYDVKKSFNITISAGRKPNCTVEDNNVLVKSSDPEDTVYVNFTCQTDGSNQGDIDFDINNDNEDNFFDVDSTNSFDQGRVLGYAVISLDTVFSAANFPSSITVTVTNVYGSVNLMFPVSVDNTPPRFTDSTTEKSVLETVPSGELVYTFSAMDDESSDLEFSVKDAKDSGASIPFNISTTGQLSTVGSLQASQVSSYLLTITVTDPDGLSVSRNFTVTVRNVNHNPQCVDTAGTVIDITVSVGHSVVTLQCTDEDVMGPDSQLTYTIGGESPDFKGFFGFNENNTQEIQLVKSLEDVDISVTPSTSFTVTVSDQGSPPLSDTVTVTITFSDNRPTCSQNNIPYSITEKTAMSSCFNVTHNCDDPTSFGMTFALTELASDEGFRPLTTYFGIGNSDGSTDPSVLSYVTICIIQNVNGLPGIYKADMQVSNEVFSTTVQLTIDVTDVNDPPIINDLPADKTFIISETATVQTVVANLTITDPDPGNNGILSFSFEATDPSVPDSGDFMFDDDTTTIEVSQALNATRQDTYTYTLTVTDGGGLSVSENVTISVEDVNEAPQCEQPEDFTVDATSGPDYVLGKLTCWDNDAKTEYKEIVYTVQSGAVPVLIDVMSDGEIKLLDSIPYDNDRITYTVTVGNPAQGNNPGPSINITVTIVYNKEFPPSCNATSMVVNFQDTDNTGCGIGKVKCTNPLQGAPTFLTAETNLTDNFEIGDEQDQSSLSLRICANDGFNNDIGTYEVKTVVTNGLRNVTIVWKVTVTDVNEPPYFQHNQYYRDLSENTAVGTEFAAVFVLNGAFMETDLQTWDGLDAIRVTDPDVHTDMYQIQRIAARGSFRWKGNGTSVESSNLPIVYENNVFRVKGLLDESLLYLFTLEVFDGANNDASVVYTINITDVNEPPTCTVTSLTFDVSLLVNVDTLLDTLVCSDPDYDADKTQTEYTVDGTDKDFFQVTSAGEIKVGSKLPRDKNTLTFQVVASDKANSSLAHVIDVNVTVDRVISVSCSPVEKYPTVWVINSCVSIDLKCTDPTADETSSIGYTVSGNYTTGFNLTGAEGVYQLCYMLTSNGVYIFEVEVDNGLKPSTQTVQIEVVYLSSTPQFDQQSYKANVSETDAVDTTVLTVRAHTEGNHTGNITYKITDFDPASTSTYFHVVEETGEIKLDRNVSVLVVAGIDIVTLTIQATDDYSRLKSSVNVKLNIQEVNVAPECQGVADQSVGINTAGGDRVVQLACSDANYRAMYNTIAYSIQSNYFAVDSDGLVSIKSSLPLNTDTHALRVMVTDGEFNQAITFTVNVNMASRPTLKATTTTRTSIHLVWSFTRSDYPQIVQRYILAFEPEGQTPSTEIISKNMWGSVLTNLQPGTNYQIVLHAETQYGNFSSVLIIASTLETPVLTWMTIRYKDKNTAWETDFNNPNTQPFKDYAAAAEATINEVMMDVTGLHDVRVIGLSSGSVLVDAQVAVNQTGNITDAEQIFKDRVYSGKLGTTDVDPAVDKVIHEENFADISSLSVVSGDSQFVNEGTTVILECAFRLVGIGLTPKVTWSRNSKVIRVTKTGKFKQTITTLTTDTLGYKATLKIQRVGLQDSGGYICEVKADVSNGDDINERKSLLLTVREKPLVDLRPLSSYVESRSTVELNCTFLSGEDNSVQFKWYRDNTLISNPPVTQITSKKQKLTISSALSNSVYYCQVINIAGSTNSETANIFIIRSDVDRCPSSTDSQGTEWMSTPVGQTVKVRCPKGYDGFLVRKCEGDGKWEKPKYTSCRLKTLISIQQKVETLEDGIEESEPDDLVNTLQNVTASQTLIPGDIDMSINIMERVVNVTMNRDSIKTDFVKNFVNTANNMLSSDKDNWDVLEETEDKNGVTTLMKTLDTVGQVASQKVTDDDSNNNGSLTIITTNQIVLAYGKTSLKDIVFPQLEDDEYPPWMQQSRTRVILRKDSFSASLPEESKRRADGFMGYSAVYYKAVDELIDDSENKVQEEEKETLMGKKLNSKVLSFSLNPHISSKLNPMLQLTFEHVNGNFSKPVCSFLDFSHPYGRRGRWSSQGCYLVNSTVNLTVCECDHLTNFAVLMSPGRVSEQDARILSIISAVGCGISILFLLITICIYACLWRYVKSDRAIILMNLCVALIIAYSIFLGGVTQTQNKDVCTAIAALLHFFFLVVFFLMLAEGVEVLVSVVYVFNTRSRLKWLLALSWGVPLVVLGISLGVTKLEGYGNDEFCWLSLDSGLLWAFVAPALAVILANLIIVFIVLKTMFSTTAMMTKTAMEKGRAGLKALCVLLPLMGVTWVFGVFSVNEDLIVFQYLFAVFNSLQGFFIFIFHCLVSRQVQDGMRNRRRRYRAKSFKTMGTESSSQLPASGEDHIGNGSITDPCPSEPRPTSYKLNSTSEDDKPVNDLDRKVASPFIEADRQVQQIANKLYPSRDNLMDNNKTPKSPNKVNVPIDLSDIKLQNATDSSGKFFWPENGQLLTAGHVLLTEEPSIEENDAIIIGSPSKRPRNGAPPSPKKTAWGELDKSAPVHFSDYRLGEAPLKKSGQLPPLKNTGKPRMTLLEHYGPPPPDILANPAIQGWTDPDLEAKLRDRRERIEEVHRVKDSTPNNDDNKARKQNAAKRVSSQSQKSRSSNSSASHKAEPVEESEEVETIQLYQQRDLPLYRGRNDDFRQSRLKSAADKRKRQQKFNYTEPPRMIVNSEEDLSRYGKRQPFGGIRTSADVGMPGMTRPRQQRDIRWHDENQQYW